MGMSDRCADRHRLPDPVTCLVVAAILSIDLALKQVGNGSGMSDLLPW